MDYEDPTLFEGIRFYLAGFNPLIHDQARTKIVSCGGVYAPNYSPDCTHVIVYNLLLDDPICVAARRDGKALVTDSWIDQSFEAGKPADISSWIMHRSTHSLWWSSACENKRLEDLNLMSKAIEALIPCKREAPKLMAEVMYRPAKELNGVPGAKELLICLTGYHSGRRSYIMTMVKLMGAEFSKALHPANVTHLICYKFEGDKYVMAKKFPTIKIINHQWLEDCLKEWKLLPEEHYSKSSYELEMMEAVAPDSEEETIDITARLTNQRTTVQNETGNALDNSVIVSRVSIPSEQRPSNNVRKDEVRLPFEPEQVLESEIRHKIDKDSPVQQKSDGHNVRKMPLKSDRPLQDEEELGNLSEISPKRSADSYTDYSGPLNSRKTAKRSNVSAGKSGSSNRKTKEYLESDDIRDSYLEADKMKVASAGFGGSNSKGLSEVHASKYSPSSPRRSSISLQPAARLIAPEGRLQHLAEKVIGNVNGCNVEPDKNIFASELFGLTSTEAVLPDGEGQCALPQSKQRSGHSDVSRITPKLQKLKATASKRIDASEPPSPVSSPLKKSKNSSLRLNNLTDNGTVRTSEDKSSTDVPSRSLAFEKLQVGNSDNMNTRTSPTSGNAISCASSGVENKKAKPQNSPEITSFSPEIRKLEASKSGNSKLNSDDQIGSSGSKLPRKKMVAKRTLGSRPKVSEKTADAQKGSLSGNFPNDDAALHLTGQIEGKDHPNPSVADKITAAQTVGGSYALESKPLQDSSVDEPFNNDTESLPDFVVHQNYLTESSRLTKTRARATSGMLDCQTDEAETTNSRSANTYKQGMEHAKQNLAQKEISGRANGKTVISAPKEVIQDADDNVGGKESENKKSVKRQTGSAAGKKRRGGQLVKRPDQVENEPVASDDPGVCNANKCLGNLAVKKRRGTLVLNKFDTPVEVEKNIESGHDKDGQHDGDKQPEKLSVTSNSSEVLMEIENERDTFAGNDQTTKKGVKHTGNNRRGTLLSTKSVSLISAEKENLPFVDGKPGKLSGISNNSVVGDNQGAIKGKKVVGKKRRGTLVLNKAEGPVEAENENEPLIHDDEVKSKGESLKSDLSVRDSNAISSDPSTIQSGLNAVKNEPACFIVSGHRLQRKEFQQLIKRLKGKHCRDSHQWSYQATHFIVPDPIRRTEKFFAAAASGRWILKTDYLTESIQAGKFLPEEPYEWHKNGLTEDGAINFEAPRKWRLLREKTGHGAFYGMRILVYGECIAPPLDTLKRVVKAGDGTILATSPPYTRFLNSGVDFAIVSPGMPRVDIWVQEFLRHEIPCVSADYLVEYVCKPGYPLDRHVQYNTHEWAAKSFERLLSLSIESVADAATPENQVSDDLDLACQVCGCSDRAEVMLVCGDESGSTGCGVGTHIDCCVPPLDVVPVADWFCPKCTHSRTKLLASTKRSGRLR